MCPRTTAASQRPCSGMGWYMRRLCWSLTAFNLARICFEIVIRFSQKRPFLDFARQRRGNHLITAASAAVGSCRRVRGARVPAGYHPAGGRGR